MSKHNLPKAPVIRNDPAIIAETDIVNHIVTVKRNELGKYDVSYNNVVKHPHCTAEDAIRVMATYLYEAQYQLEKLKKSQAPEHVSIPVLNMLSNKDQGFSLVHTESLDGSVRFSGVVITISPTVEFAELKATASFTMAITKPGETVRSKDIMFLHRCLSSGSTTITDEEVRLAPGEELHIRSDNGAKLTYYVMTK